MKKKPLVKSVKKNKSASYKAFLALIFLASVALSFMFSAFQRYGTTADPTDKRHLQLFSERQRQLVLGLPELNTPDETGDSAVEICSDLKGAKFREIQHCYSEVLYFVTKEKGQKFAFSTISKILSNPKNPAKACHLMAHGVGNGIYDKDPSGWQDAIGKASSECSFGQIHGILEGYSSSGNNPFDKSKISAICAKNHDPACYHGLGHVIIAQMDNNLHKSTDLCYVLKEKGAQGNCLNGVFMENMIGQTLEVHGLVTSERRKLFYEHLDEFIELCNKQTNQDLIRACWIEMIHASVVRFKGDAEKVFALCAKAQTADAASGCRLHSLAELVPRKGFDPFKAAYMCKIPIANEPEFEGNCYNMIVSVIMANSPGKIDLTADFCASLNSSHNLQCLSAVKRQIATLRKQDPERANALCQSADEKSGTVCGGEVGFSDSGGI